MSDYTNKLLDATREQLIYEILRLRGEHARLQPKTCPRCGRHPEEDFSDEETVFEDRHHREAVLALVK